MASTYSTNLKIELMGTGENSGTWGTITNTNLGTAFEQAVIGLGNPDYTSDANLTITLTNSNAAQAARALVLNVTSAFGSLTATRELIVPTIQKQYIVQNNTTGGQSITVKTSAGTGITVPTGRKAHLYVDGTNVIQMFDFVDINGGTIDGATVGAASASTGAFTSLTASGATTLNGAVALGDAAGDLITVPGTVNSNLLFTDATYDIGASGATRPRDMFLSRNLTVGGTLTLAGGVNLNGNVTVGDTSADTLTINSTITSNLIFTDNTYDIGASGATRPRSLFLAGNITAAGNQTLTGALTVDSTTDSTSTTTGSIQTDGGVGIAKALFVGTTANIAGVATFSAGSAAAPAITTTGDTNTGIWFPAADTIAFTEGGVESMRIDSAGNVGIGTTAPGVRLAVEQTSAAAYVGFNVTNASSTGYVNHTLYVGSGGANGQSGTFYAPGLLYQIGVTANDTTSPITFVNNNGTERARITSTGNVGIGTSSPAGNLDVAGSTSQVSSKVTNTNTAGQSFNQLITNTAALYSAAFGSTAGGTTWAGLTGNSQTVIEAQNSSSLVIGAFNNSAPIIFAQGRAEKIRIDTDGNLGINNTSPAVLATTTQVAIKANSSADAMFVAQNSNGLTTAKFGFQFTGGVDNPVIGSYTDHPFIFQTNNTERARFTGSAGGSLLVGTTTLRPTGYTTGNSQYAMETTAYGGAQWFVNRTDVEGAYIVLGKSGGTTVNSNTVVANGDTLGAVIWQGATGSGVASAAQVRAKVDGSTISSSSMPGRLEFYTTPSGSTTMTERMRIASDGNVVIGALNENVASANQRLLITGSPEGATLHGIFIHNNSFSDASARIALSPRYSFLYNTSPYIQAVSESTSAAALTFGTTTGSAVSERMRINSTGDVIVGSTGTVDSSKFQIFGAKTFSSGIPQQQLNIADTTAIAAGVGGAISFSALYTGGAYTTMGSVEGVRENATSGNYAGALVFRTRTNGSDNNERARITAAGELLIGKTVNTFATAGIVLNVDGNKYSTFTRNGGGLADFNRTGDDGNLIAFWQDGTQEGNITVTGTTVSYNGGHLSRYAQTTTPKDDSLVKGTVLSNLDEMSIYTKDGQPVANEQLNKVKVSDIEGDANVAGVFVSWSHDEEHNVDEINMAMTGDMIIRIAQGVTVVRGDLLMSAGDGTAKPQGDDIIRSKTVAKVTSNHVTCTYADGSYCVPCVLMAC